MFGGFRKNILFSLLIRTLLNSNFPPQRLAQMVKRASLFMKEQMRPGGSWHVWWLPSILDGCHLGPSLWPSYWPSLDQFVIFGLWSVQQRAACGSWLQTATLYQSGPGNKSRALLNRAVMFTDPQRLLGQSTHISCLGDEKWHWTTFFWCSGKKILLPEALTRFVGKCQISVLLFYCRDILISLSFGFLCP